MTDLVKGKSINKTFGAGFPVNSLALLQVGGVIKHTATDNTVWLKSGYAETDTASYPDANSTYILNIGFEANVLAQEGSPQGICTDELHIYVIGYASDSVHKYLKSTGSFVTSYSVAAQSATPYDLAWDGTNFWMWGDNKIFKYSASFVYMGTPIPTQTDGQGLAFDTANNTLWLLTTTGGMWEYDRVTGYTGRTFETGYSNARALAHDGVNFWITQHNNTNAVSFDGVTFSYTGEVFAVDYNYVYGITHDGTDTFYVVRNNGDLFGYTAAIGCVEVSDSSSNLPFYMRIL